MSEAEFKANSKQFQGGLKYGEGVLQTKKVAIASGVIVVAIVVPVLLTGPPATRSHEVTPVEIPAAIYTTKEMDIPEFQERMAAGGSVSYGRKNSVVYLKPQLLSRPRDVVIPPGSLINAVLLSGASNGLIRAKVTEGFSFNGESLIEEGSIALGEGSSTEKRLFIRFDQVVAPSGDVTLIQGQALDSSDQLVGLKGSRIGKYAWKMGAGIGLNFLGAFSETLQDSEVQGGVALKKPTLKNALLGGAAQAAIDQSKEIVGATKNEAPVIEVPAGRSIVILIQSSGEGQNVKRK